MGLRRRGLPGTDDVWIPKKLSPALQRGDADLMVIGAQDSGTKTVRQRRELRLVTGYLVPISGIIVAKQRLQGVKGRGTGGRSRLSARTARHAGGHRKGHHAQLTD